MAELLPLLLPTAGEHQGKLLASAEASHLVVHAKVNLPLSRLAGLWPSSTMLDPTNSTHFLASADQGATG